MEVLELTMLKDRRHWEPHYGGDGQTAHLLRRCGSSDCGRYYWNEPRARDAGQALLSNLGQIEVPETTLSAYLPESDRAVRAGLSRPEAKTLLLDRMRQVTALGETGNRRGDCLEKSDAVRVMATDDGDTN